MEVTRTVEINGEEHEVEVEVDPDEVGMLTKDEFKKRLSQEVAKVRKAERQKADGKYSLDELTSNEELLEELRERNPELFATEDGDGDGTSGLTEEELERRLEKLRKKEVEPLKQELETYQTEAKRLRVEKLDREVVEAAGELGVRRGLIPLVKRFYRDQMDYSADHREWFKRDGDGFEPSVDDDFDGDYVTVLEDLKQRKASGDFDDWFESSTREGAGYGGSEGGGQPSSGSIKDMSEQERMDFIDEHGYGEYKKLVRQSFAPK